MTGLHGDFLLYRFLLYLYRFQVVRWSSMTGQHKKLPRTRLSLDETYLDTP